jgi:hypothetical protein
MTVTPAPVERKSWSVIFEVYELAAFQHLSYVDSCLRSFALR